MQTRTVQVRRLSDLATEREVHEFFSFSGEIEHVEIRRLHLLLIVGCCRESGQSKTAYVTFKDPQALEIALLLSGATIVDQVVAITPAEDYVPQSVIQEVRIIDNAINMSYENTSPVSERKISPNNGRVYVTKAQDVMSNMIAKGSVLGQDAVNKAKAFDEKHRLSASASARAASFDHRVGLTEKFTVGISVVNEKVKSVDQKFHVSDRTMSALMAAEKKINDTGSAVKSSRYVIAGTTWLNGAFSKMAKAGQVARTKTREKWSSAVSNLTSKDPPIAA